MAGDLEGFHHLHAAEDLRFVKHNPTDFENFKRFQENIDAKYAEAEKRRERKERKNNLLNWERLIGPRWADANLKTIENDAQAEIVETLRREGKSSFFIHGPSSSGKSYLAYAVLRAYISSGWVTPSQIERISEEALMGMAGTGFEGMNRFNKLLAPSKRVYFIDGVGRKQAYREKEQQLWEQLIDHIYSNFLTVIFTSNDPLDSFGAYLSDSADSKLQHLVGVREVVSRSTRAAPKKAKNARVSSSIPTPKFGADGTLL